MGGNVERPVISTYLAIPSREGLVRGGSLRKRILSTSIENGPGNFLPPLRESVPFNHLRGTLHWVKGKGGKLKIREQCPKTKSKNWALGGGRIRPDEGSVEWLEGNRRRDSGGEKGRGRAERMTKRIFYEKVRARYRRPKHRSKNE